MLRFVLGGIALAATGYAIKEYCESEACWDEWLDTVETQDKEKATVKNTTFPKEETPQQTAHTQTMSGVGAMFSEIFTEKSYDDREIAKPKEALAHTRRMLRLYLQQCKAQENETSSTLDADIQVTEAEQHTYPHLEALLEDMYTVGNAYLKQQLCLMEIAERTSIEIPFACKEAMSLLKIFDAILDAKEEKLLMDEIAETIEQFICFKQNFEQRGE